MSLIVALSLVPISVMLAVVVDVGRVWVARVTLQNGVETAATKSARSWINGGLPCSGIDLHSVSVDGAAPSSVSCASHGTSTRGSVTVEAAQSIPLMFSRLIGRTSGNAVAATGVRIGPTLTMAGLWPLALCVNHPAVQRWVGSTLQTSSDEIINFQATATLCGAAPGNWAVLDFNGGANSTAETRDWVLNGYSGVVRVDDQVPGNTGAPATSAGVAEMVGKDVNFALFDAATGTGSNAVFHIVGFAHGLLVEAVENGPSARRHLTIRFSRSLTDGQAGDGSNVHYGISTWSVCSHDGQGTCS